MELSTCPEIIQITENTAFSGNNEKRRRKVITWGKQKGAAIMTEISKLMFTYSTIRDVLSKRL
jgi:hypothetical protein